MEFRLFQSVAVVTSVLLTALVLELIRRRKLKDELWLPWLLLAVAPLLAGLWIAPWAALARWLDIAYEPALLLALGTFLCLAMILHLTVVVSGLMRNNVRLAQEVAALRLRLDAAAPEPRR
jgi:hypothetical protein